MCSSTGCKFAFIIAAFLDLLIYLDAIKVMPYYYIIAGLWNKNPWNRCDTKSYVTSWNVTINCYELGEFAKKFANDSVVFSRFGYLTRDKEFFQLAQVEYYRRIYFEDDDICSISCGILWILCGLCHTQVFKKSFWKVLNVIHWSVNFIEIMAFMHLVLTNFLNQYDESTKEPLPFDEITESLWVLGTLCIGGAYFVCFLLILAPSVDFAGYSYMKTLCVAAAVFEQVLGYFIKTENADIAMLAESMTAPPLVHVLTARSTQEIKPSWDSAVMITSNALYYIFRGLLAYRLSKYCENLGKTTILLTVVNQQSWLYLWPIYFTTFYFGDLYTILFFIVNFLMEFLIVMVTFQCLIEVIVCEWRWANRWLIVASFCVVALALEILDFDADGSGVVYFFIKTSVTLLETLVLYVLYPVGRLIDDITFHCGIPPTKLRIMNFKLIPVYYAYKAYALMSGVSMVYVKIQLERFLPHYKLLRFAIFIPMILGIPYAVYKYVFKLKKNWSLLFLPDALWGPKDHTMRQLRKQYDSRVYVASQAPRALSQYLLEKAESKAYQLDLRYDFSRRSTAPSAELRLENEKKNL